MTPSILIIGCDPYLAGIYGRKFENDGWEVDIAESMADGERRAAKMRPSILLIDDSCVADAAKQIARLRSLPTILSSKIVLLGHVGERAKIDAALAAGANDYLLTGHFVPQEAVEKMRRLVKS